MTTLTRRLLAQCGAMTLVTSVILFMVSSLIIIFAANFGIMLQKTATNTNQNAQAFQAAEAGLEYAINYLQKNSTTILANTSNGYLVPYSDSNITDVSLADGSKFSVVYSNPVANNYTLILITSTGTSPDGSAVRVVSQRVQQTNLINNIGTTPIVSKGTVTTKDLSTVTNLSTNQTITSGTTVKITDFSRTITATGGSTAWSIGADVQSNNSSLSSMAQDYFIANYLGSSSTNSLIGKAAIYYSSNSNTNYTALLSGLTGTSVFINQTSGVATINGSITIGSVASPVLLIVNGGLRLAGNLSFYGFIINIGTNDVTQLQDNAVVRGAIATMNNLSTNNFSSIVYSSSVLSNLQNLNSMKSYAKVPGTWKDF